MDNLHKNVMTVIHTTDICFVWVRNSVSHLEGKTYIQGAEDNMWS